MKSGNNDPGEFSEYEPKLKNEDDELSQNYGSKYDNHVSQNEVQESVEPSVKVLFYQVDKSQSISVPNENEISNNLVQSLINKGFKDTSGRDHGIAGEVLTMCYEGNDENLKKKVNQIANNRGEIVVKI